jgi:hypothetical protein
MSFRPVERWLYEVLINIILIFLLDSMQGALGFLPNHHTSWHAPNAGYSRMYLPGASRPRLRSTSTRVESSKIDHSMVGSSRFGMNAQYRDEYIGNTFRARLSQELENGAINTKTRHLAGLGGRK